MRTLVVQPVSAGVLHCYVEGGSPFGSDTAAKLSRVPGVKSVHLVTPGRAALQWCLVVEPTLPVGQSNAEWLRRLASGLSQRVGCSGVKLLRSLTRPTTEAGRATDIYDWLKE